MQDFALLHAGCESLRGPLPLPRTQSICSRVTIHQCTAAGDKAETVLIHAFLLSGQDTLLGLQDIFGLFIWVFRKLEDPSSPSYQLKLSVLDTVGQVWTPGCGVLFFCFWLAGQELTFIYLTTFTGQMLLTYAGLGQ